MKQFKILTVCLMLLFLGNLSVFAQEDGGLATTTETERKGAFNESADMKDETVEEEIPYYYRQHKKLPTFFSGYAIELTTSDLPLRRDYSLFEKFGNVYVDHLETEGGFSYLIDGFKNEKAATSFLNNIVIHNAPEARVILYDKGERKLK